MSGQARLFLLTVGIGLCSGLFYDLFRILRLYIKHNDIITHIEDLLFWLLVAAVTFYIFLNKHYGEIRGFCFLGAGLGMVLWFTAASRFFLRGACAVVNFVLKLLHRVFMLIAMPVKALARLLKGPYEFIRGRVKKALQNIRNYTRIKMILLKRDINIMFKKV
jgi:spore cortex biosynthesis protein YabQ